MAVCYLCAYLRSEIPMASDPFPTGNVWAWTEALGTCKRCSVWSCGVHGTRYGNSQPASFECAICTPAQAVKDAVGTDSDSVAVAAALRTAAEPGSNEERSFRHALERIQSPSVRAELTAAFQVALPYDYDQPRGGPVDGYPPAVAAAVRAALGERELALRPRSGQIVSGAVRLAYEVADPFSRGGPDVQYSQLIDPVVRFVDFVERASRE